MQHVIIILTLQIQTYEFARELVKILFAWSNARNFQKKKIISRRNFQRNFIALLFEYVLFSGSLRVFIRFEFFLSPVILAFHISKYSNDSNAFVFLFSRLQCSFVNAFQLSSFPICEAKTMKNTVNRISRILRWLTFALVCCRSH